jgi:hypothetical protein
MKTATEILIQAMEELGDSPHAKVLVLIDDALQREKSKIPDATE